jgi:hypothetical protein
MNSSHAINPKTDANEVVPVEFARSKLPVEDACDENSLLTKKELARKLKKSVRSIENWMKLGYLPYIKIGHSVLFKWCDVSKALDLLQVR